MCPTVSGLSPSSFTYTAGIGGAKGTAGTGVKIKCNYTGTPSEAVLFSSTLSTYFDGGDTVDPIKTMRADFCSTKGFAALQASTNCQNFYRANNNLNAQYIQRILSEKPTTWPDDQAMREMILNVSLSTNAAEATQGATEINRYCLTTNPSGWAQNANMRAFINHLYDSDPAAKTNADLRQHASTIVNTFCGNTGNQSKIECGCYNAQTRRFSGCVGNASTPGCAELDSLDRDLSKAPAAFSSIIATLKSPAGIKPTCVSAACVEARQNPGGSYLRTTDAQTMDCSDNISLCMQSIRAGGSIAPGATINQSCSTVLNIQGNVVPAGGINLNGNIQQRGDDITVNGGGQLGTAPPGYVMVKGTTYKLSDFIIKPGKSKFVDSYIGTPKKQKGAIGGMIVILCLCMAIVLIAMFSGEDEVPELTRNEISQYLRQR
jgi:hypothetical protein